MNRLKGKSTIVIGATSGMGESIAKMFANEGAEVIFTGRRSEKGLAIEKDIIDAGGKACFVQADSTKSEDLEKVLRCAMEKFGKIDVLVNNAGVGTTGEVEATSMEAYDRTMDINIRSYYEACHATAPFYTYFRSFFIRVTY